MSAASDVGRIEALTARGVDVELYAHHGAAEHMELRFSLYVAEDRVSLSEVLPILHSLGVEVLDERPYRVPRPDGLATRIYDFGLNHRQALTELSAGGPNARTVARRFCDTFLAAWRTTFDVDGFNALVLGAGLTYDEAALLRAYAKYLRQNGFPYSCERIAAVLVEHPRTCVALVELFGARTRPGPDLAGAGDADRPCEARSERRLAGQ